MELAIAFAVRTSSWEVLRTSALSAAVSGRDIDSLADCVANSLKNFANSASRTNAIALLAWESVR